MRELFDFLVKNSVTPNGYLVLHSTFHSYMYPNYINFRHEQYRLEMTGHLKEEKKDVGSVYVLTEKGLHLLREAEEVALKAKRAKKAKIPLAEWEDNIKRFNEMFPRSKKEGTNLSFRTNPKELMERFVWFFKEYPDYTWEQVFQATQKYCDSFDESTGYTYMQISKYFIKKDDKFRSTSSTLANMIYNMLEGNDEEVSSGYHYFGP